MKKQKRMLNFGLLICGFVFLFNPNVNIIDILPDFIGYICIFYAIDRISGLCPELSEAKDAFLRLIWITLSKIPAFLLMMWIVATNVGEEISILVFAFCYAIAEVYFGIRAFSLYFDGLSYLGTRENGGEFLYSLPYGKTRKSSKHTGSLTVATAVFLIAKSVLSVLPELSLLSSYDGAGDIVPESVALYNFRPFLIVISAVVALVFGVVWLFKMCRYTRYISKYREFWHKMSVEYESKVAVKTGMFVMRRVRIFSAVCAIAVAFSVDMYIDEINILPDFLSAAAFFIAALLIAKYADRAKGLKIASVIYFVLSVCTFVTMAVFNSQYSYNAVHKIENAARLYRFYAISNAVEQIAFIAVVCALAAVIRSLVSRHTGINSITGVSNTSRPLEKVFAVKTVVMRSWAVLMAAMSMAYFYFVVDVQGVQLANDATSGGGYVYFPKFEVAWMLDLLIAVIFACYTINLLYDLLSEVRYKYKYE